jgi:hypothetical protein
VVPRQAVEFFFGLDLVARPGVGVVSHMENVQ